MPVDVAENPPRGTRPVLEHAVPRGVAAGADPHVVRNEVHDVVHAMARDGRTEVRERFGASKLRVDLVVIADVVAMSAAGRGGEVGRRVARRYAKLREIRHDIASRWQWKLAIDL